MDWVFHNAPAQFVRFADDLTAAHAAAGHPHREGKRVMVAPAHATIERRAILTERRAAKLRRPHHERLVEQPALFQIPQQRADRLIDDGAIERQILLQLVVMIPRGVVDADEAHVALDEPAGHQTIAREGFERSDPATALGLGELARIAVYAVRVQRLRLFIGKIRQLRRGELHARGQFVARNAAGDFGIADHLLPHGVQVAQRVETVMAHLRRHAGGIVQVHDRLAFVAQQHALKSRGQEAAGEHRVAAARRAPRREHDVARQILRRAAQRVSDPRANARPSEALRAGVHQQFAGMMIERLRVHRAHQRDVVRARADVRQHRGHLRAVFSVTLKLVGTAEQFRGYFEKHAYDIVQPDMGTAFIISASVVTIIAVSGAPSHWVAGLLIVAVLGAVVATKTGVISEYQLNRLQTFVDPTADTQGAGYQLRQARITVGSGGLIGTGLFNGPQTNGRFVPEQQTDFIFTVAGEELGFVGSGFILFLYLLVLMRAFSIARRTSDPFGRLVTTGVIAWFAFQLFENIGMTLGLMPMTGVPLPFISYGGSSMFATLIGFGLLQNVHARSKG